MNSEFPAAALCDVADCGHRYDDHKVGICQPCKTNMERGFSVVPAHAFVPRRLAGGALTGTDERAQFEAAKRGESVSGPVSAPSLPEDGLFA